MAFFEQENMEVKKLKQQITAQDLRIGLLESEKTTAQRRVDELNSRLSTLGASASSDSQRAIAAESTLARLQTDFHRQAVEQSNLQQALAKAEEKYNQDLRGRKVEGQRIDLALESQLRQELEQNKKLEDRVKNLESRLRDSEELSKRAEEAAKSNSHNSVTLLAQTAALEDHVALLQGENSRLQSALTLVNGHAGASSSGSLSEAEGKLSEPGHVRRGRASSLSGAPTLASSSSQIVSRAQLHDLQTLYDEARSELTRLEARATKAEKDALKASNEVLAKEKQCEKVVAELRSELKTLREDLRWKLDECDSLAKDLGACEGRLEQAEARSRNLDISKAHLERQIQDVKDGNAFAGATPQQEIIELTKQLQQASNRCEELESQLVSHRGASESPTADDAPNGDARSRDSQESSHSDLRTLKDLRRSLSLVTLERDALKREVGGLEDEVERLQSSQTVDQSNDSEGPQAELSKRNTIIEELTSQLQSLREQLLQREEPPSCHQREARLSRDIVEEELLDKLARLGQDYSERDTFCSELQANIAGLERKMSEQGQRDDARLIEREDLRDELQKQDKASTLIGAGRAAADEARSDGVNEILLEELRCDIRQLEKDLADKDFAIEEADALAEEDSRHLRMKETEVKRLNEDVARLRQKAKEAALEMDILRASASEGDVESSLNALRAQLDIRDDQLLKLRTSLKSREDELELGKKQLKRIAAFIGSRSATASSGADLTFSTPQKNGSVHKSRISFGVAATPIGSILKSKHFFSTPGGRQLQRGFDEDLLDQIELIRESIEQTEEQQRFVNAERIADVKAVRAELEKKTADAEQLAVEIGDAHSHLAKVTSERQREAEADKEALLAEKELIALQCQEQVAGIVKEVTRLQQELELAQTKVATSETELQASLASHQSSKAELESQLEAANARATEVAALMQQLLSKRQQLFEFQTTTQRVEQADRVLQGEESHLTHLEGSLNHEERMHQDWKSMIAETQASLADDRQRLQAAADRPQVVISSPLLDQSTSDGTVSQLTKLRIKIDELEGRVLRREEQIGSLQLKLENVTTQQCMAEEDYEELMEEKIDVEAALASLQQKLDSLLREHAEVIQSVKAEAEEANEALKATATRLQEEISKGRALEETNVELSMKANASEPAQNIQRTADDDILRLELCESQKRVDELQEELMQRQGDLDTLQRSLQEHRDSVLTLQSAHDELAAGSDLLNASNSRSAEAASETIALESESKLAQMQEDKRKLEQELVLLSSAQQEEGLKDQETITQLRVQLSDLEDRASTLVQTSDLASQELESSVAALATARQCADALAERLRVAEAARDEAAEQVTMLVTEQAANKKGAETIHALEEQVSALQDQTSSLQEAHDRTVQQLQSDLAQALESAKAAQEASGETERAAQHLLEQATELLRLEKLVGDLEDSKSALQQRCERLEIEAAASNEAARMYEVELQKTVDDVQSQLVAVQEELAYRQAAFTAAEKAIEERDEHIKSRNEEFWNVKEELAELQEHQERSRAAASSLEMLEERLQSAQGEILELREKVGSAAAEVLKARAEVEAAERESILRSSEVADLQGEMKRRKAANRFNEEEILALRDKLEEATAAWQESVVELKTVELQLNAAKQDVERLEGEVAAQRSAPIVQSASEDLVEEISYLKARIEDMEHELTAKADEIEEADTRILTGLKENKKLSSRMKNLQKQIVVLQSASSTGIAGQPAAPRQADTSAPTPPAPTKDPAPSAIHAAFSPDSVPSGRKRSAPEDSTTERAHLPTNSVRAVYQPSVISPQRGTGRTPRRGESEVGGGRFTPLRRSPVKGEAFLQDRTNTNNIGRVPLAATISAAMVKGSGTTESGAGSGQWLLPTSDKKAIAPLPGGTLAKERRPLLSTAALSAAIAGSGGGGSSSGSLAPPGGGSGLMAALAKRKLTTRA